MEFLQNIDWKSIFLFDAETPLIFTQMYFWVFFGIVMVFFSLLHKQRAARNAFLFFASLFFYWKTSGFFFSLLIFSTLSDYLIGFRIHSADKKAVKRTWMIISVVINLALLGYFKYTYLFADTVNTVAGSTLIEPTNIFAWAFNSLFGTDFIMDKILLPVGISFYTFQTISYSVDVFHGKIKPVKSILDFGFYVSFFPQLVAGPIVRASEFIPQIYQPYKVSRQEFGLAVFWILQGLVKKMFLADYVAVNFVDRVFENPEMYTGFENLIGLYGYSLQVYADFSGYTDIAIGIALLMGFRLPLNFNSPYKADSVGNFWKRWHISLSTWLKDYLYIPLGGSRAASFVTFLFVPLIIAVMIYYVGVQAIAAVIVVGIMGTLAFMWVSYYHPKIKKTVATHINLLITMLLGGLWHGASWLFVIWGGLNGAALVVFKTGKEISEWDGWRNWGYRIASIVGGILITVFMLFLFHMGGMNDYGLITFGLWVGVSLIGLLIYMMFRKWVKGKAWWKMIARVWAIFLTFNFISYTRVWFRHETMEGTDKMLHQIYNDFGWDLIPKILISYAPVFLVIYYGYVIHWLPVSTKEGYKKLFIKMPLPLQVLAAVFVVVLIYQVMTSDLQPFIYFQF